MSRRATRRRLALAVLAAVFAVASAGPAQATFHGRNGRVVLQSETSAHGVQLYTIQPASGTWRRVTDVAGYPIYPDWSPDGHQIAFEVDAPSDDRCRIMLMRADGSRLRNLSHHRSACEQNPSFTPDGRRIVFVAQGCMNCTERIWSMNLRGHDRRAIAESPPGLHSKDPNVSPDGTMVSFVAENEQNRAGVFVVGMDGRGLRKIVPLKFDVERKHDWAPSGRRILFNDNANEIGLPSNLMTIRPDGTGLRRITHFKRGHPATARKAHVGSYSPNGRWIVYRFTVGEERSELLRRPVGGGPPRQVVPRGHLVLSGNGDWGAAVG